MVGGSSVLRRVFLTDALTCPKCHGRMKILAAITKPEAIRKILDHLGIPSEAPRCTAARPRGCAAAASRAFGHVRPRRGRLR